jgi:hypothetical protein
MKKSINKFLILFAIAVSAITLTSCTSLPLMGESTLPTIRTISVSGSGSVNATPDISTLSVQISETEDTSSEALQAMNEKMSSVLKICDIFEVQEKDRRTNSINLRTDYDWIDSKQVVNGQVASQSISIKLRDIDNLGPIIDELSKINKIIIGSISFSKENTDAEASQARILAVEDAYQKALEIAKAAGMFLKCPITINNTSSPVNYNYPTMMKSSSMEVAYDNRSTQAPTGEVKITGQVIIMYEMISQ